MTFDIRTLLVVVALIGVFCTAARLLLALLHPTIPGVGRWASASLLIAVAPLLVAGRDLAWPEEPALTLAATLLAVGFSLCWDGYRRFAGLAPLPAWVFAAFALSGLPPLLVARGGNALAAHATTNALVIALLSVFIARDLLSAAPARRTAMQATGWVYAANALFFVLRAEATVRHPELAGHLPANPLATAALMWWLCILVAVTLGMTLMVSERLQAELTRQASRDPLTGALNRRAFQQLADREVARARRCGHPLSVLVMDLDHFKRINDRMGHAAGDAILCAFVALAEQELRQEDVFCRFGGEEFVALLPDCPADRAMAAAERLRAAFARGAPPLAGLPFPPTVSLGVGEVQTDEDLEVAIRRADAALYRAKALGRNRCELAALPEAVPAPEATPA